MNLRWKSYKRIIFNYQPSVGRKSLIIVFQRQEKLSAWLSTWLGVYEALWRRILLSRYYLKDCSKCFWSRRHPRLEDCPPDPRQVPAPWSWSAGPLLLLSPSVSPPPRHEGSPGPAAACSGASPGSTPGCSPARSWWDSLQFSESRIDCEKLIKMTSLTFVLISWATDVSFSLLEINSFCQS